MQNLNIQFMNTENKYIKYEYINKQGHAKY